MAEEFEFHLAQQTELEAASGQPAATARREVERRFGRLERVRERGWAARSWIAADALAHDLRVAWRSLRHRPGAPITALLCLTLGLGASTAVASWIEGALLRPFAGVAQQERMVAFTGSARGLAGAAGDATDISWPDFVDYHLALIAGLATNLPAGRAAATDPAAALKAG